MLSNLVVTPQKFITIIDELGQDKISQKFLSQLLKEQGEEKVNIKTLPLNEELNDETTLEKFLNDCNAKLMDDVVVAVDGDASASCNSKKLNILLPNFSDFLAYQKPAAILQFLNKLKKSDHVKRTFLWISLKHLQHEHAQYLIAACEYMADLILHIQTINELSLLTRKPGGGVTNKQYTYKKTKTEFLVELKKDGGKPATDDNNKDADGEKSEQLGTFKIELDEEEIVARNAMKMPYEKALEATESNIIYTPDAADDFDDEDPDEDLNI